MVVASYGQAREVERTHLVPSKHIITIHDIEAGALRGFEGPLFFDAYAVAQMCQMVEDDVRAELATPVVEDEAEDTITVDGTTYYCDGTFKMWWTTPIGERTDVSCCVLFVVQGMLDRIWELENISW